MTDFLRFPSTPYLRRPSSKDLREDKVLTERERLSFLEHRLHLEEKIDGQNLGISFDGEGLRFQARGSFVELGGRHFRGLATWVRPREARLANALGRDLVLFGEWCAVTHTVYYDALPDWFLVFDVYQLSTASFWPTQLRDGLASSIGLHTVPFLGDGHFDEQQLSRMTTTSMVGREPMEGIVARVQDDRSTIERAKLVRADFSQQIDQHWTRGRQIANRLRA